MTGRLEKFLQRLEKSKRVRIEEVIADILQGDEEKLDIKKLKGMNGVYRVRIGSIRVVYSKNGAEFDILFIGRRSDTIYRKFKR